MACLLKGGKDSRGEVETAPPEFIEPRPRVGLCRLALPCRQCLTGARACSSAQGQRGRWKRVNDGDESAL